MLTVEECTEYLKVSKLTVYSFIKSGQLKAYKIGRHQYRIFEDDLKAFVMKGALEK